MPARRFFAMLRSSRELHSQEMLNYLDLAAVPLTNSKWYDQIKDRWTQRLEKAANIGPSSEDIEREAMIAGQRPTEAETVDILKDRLALFKQLRGFGG